MDTQNPEIVAVKLRLDQEMRKRLQMASYADWKWKTEPRRRGDNTPELLSQYEVSMTVLATLLYVVGDVDTYREAVGVAQKQISDSLDGITPV